MRDVSQIHFGTEVHDPYRYMETKSDEVDAWARSQAATAIAALAALPERKAIYERLLELEAKQQAEVHSIVRAPNGRFYYQKRLPGQSIARLYERDNAGVERLLLDPEKLLQSKGSPVSLDHFKVSPDGRLLTCGISSGGSENATLYVMDMATGGLIGKPLERVRWGAVNWLPDSSGFFYNQLQYLPPGADRQETFQRSCVYLHRMAQKEGEPDEAVLRSGLSEAVDIQPSELPFVSTYPDLPWAFAHITTGVSPNYAIYICPLASVNGAKTPWRKIAGMDAQVGSATGIHGKDLYLISRKDAPNGKIIKLNLENPVLSDASTVYVDPKGVIQGMAWASDALYIKVLDGGPSRLVRLPFVDSKTGLGQPDDITLPAIGNVGLSSGDPRLSGVTFYLSPWTRPGLFWFFDPASGTCANTELVPDVAPDICKDLEATMIRVKSHDGTEVPLTLVCRKGLQKNGRHPVLLSGYGSYGTSCEPRFNLSHVPFFERGGIYAVAHARGGGEFGESWRLGGFQATKPNTWKDYIACAEYITKTSGLASPATLCGTGRSAGGILIGRAITERPDLFSAAIIGVGVCDTIRMELTPNGVPNIPEFGSVKTEPGFRALLEMSAYHHIRDGTAYPAVLLAHGANDTRVDLWQSMKMAARLQAATSASDTRPIWLRIDYSSGHGKGASADQRRALDADTLAFILARCTPKEESSTSGRQ